MQATAKDEPGVTAVNVTTPVAPVALDAVTTSLRGSPVNGSGVVIALTAVAMLSARISGLVSVAATV